MARGGQGFENIAKALGCFSATFQRGNGLCSVTGVDFHLFTERRIRTPRLQNAQQLLPAMVLSHVFHLASHGNVALLLANGSMSSGSGGEDEIPRALVEADLVKCMIALPSQLFTNTQIPACIWFLTKSKKAWGDYRDRSGQTLFLDARKLGYMTDRVLRASTVEDLGKITSTFQKWKRNAADYANLPGFCKSSTIDKIATHGFVLTPSVPSR